MAFEPIDRLPVMALEPFEQSAIERWRTEGLPDGAHPGEFLDMSTFAGVPLSLGPVPAFEQTVLAEDAGSVTQISSMGATVKSMKEQPSLFYGHVDHPIKTRRDWDEYKLRFDATSPGRHPADLTALAQRLEQSPNPVHLSLFPCFFRFGFYSMGMERFLTAFYEEPELMHEIFAHLGRFYLDLVKPILDVVRVDCVTLNEDLAGKNGPLISPSLYQEFWCPNQDPLITLCKERGVQVVCMWSAGGLDPLLSGLIEHGFNCTWPLEAMAGMDAVDLRQRYGRDLLLGGNIAKEAVITGPDAIDAEIERLRPLIREGGFLPALDDMASPDMPFTHYRYLIESLQKIGE